MVHQVACQGLQIAMPCFSRCSPLLLLLEAVAVVLVLLRLTCLLMAPMATSSKASRAADPRREGPRLHNGPQPTNREDNPVGHASVSALQGARREVQETI